MVVNLGLEQEGDVRLDVQRSESCYSNREINNTGGHTTAVLLKKESKISSDWVTESRKNKNNH